MTGFYVFFVPVISSIIASFKNNKSSPMTLRSWIAVIISLIGLFLLSGATIDDMSIGTVDLIYNMIYNIQHLMKSFT